MELDSDSGSDSVFTEILEHPEFEFKLFRQLGLSVYGASTLEECVTAARGMRMWDLEGWMRSWSRVAEEVLQLAAHAEAAGHTLSAADHYLRAANYFQMAEYYAIVCDNDHVSLGLRCEECFSKALPHLPWASERVDLVAGEVSFPAYFIAPDDSGVARPTVVIVTGMESGAEEQYFYHGVSALRRGYSVLLFQGPGQAGMLRRAPRSWLQHDYEIPLQAVLDFVHDRSDVDNDRIAVIGNGLGSYFATRVTAFDPRVKALVVNPPYVNFNRLFTELLGQRALRVDVAYDQLNEIPSSLMRGDIKLVVINLCRRFGVNRLQTLVQATTAYTVENLLYRIHCPVLCVTGTNAHREMVAQGEVFCSGVRSSDIESVRIPNLHQADAYNFVSNLPRLNQIVFDWLDERFHPSPR